MDVLAYVIGFVVIFIGLAISIALHEIGHLVPAKLFGVRVGQYMIGFGKTIWSRRRGETEYGFKLLPIGGYISMAGMYPPSPVRAEGAGTAGSGFFRVMVQDARDANDETLEGADGRTFYALSMWKRVVIMLGGPLMNLIFAVVIFTILFTGIGVQALTTTVASVNECVLPATSTSTTCAPDDRASPAAAAGLEPGDVIVSVDGRDVSTFDEVSAIVRRSPNVELDLVIERDGVRRPLTITPMLAERPVYDAQGREVLNADGTPRTDAVGFIGFVPQQALVHQPFWAGTEAAVNNVGSVVGIIGTLPVRVYETAVSLFTGQERDPNGPLSVIGVGRLAGEVATQDAPIISRVSVIVGLLGSLNVALFVFNLLPLLPLDGGHVVVALWDGIRRGVARLFRRPLPKPVDATRLVPITFVVVGLLIVMGVVLFAADILNPIQLFR